MTHAPSRFRVAGLHKVLLLVLPAAAIVFFGAQRAYPQGDGFERAFPQSTVTIEKVLKEMQAATAGRLPLLEGFATSTPDHPLDRYRRGYYQSKFQVTAAPSGGSIVRVTVQVTAWYADPVAARSGYHLLSSNGRLEADLLDQLSDQLAGKAPQGDANSSASAKRKPFPSEKSTREAFRSQPSSSPQSSPWESSPAEAVKTPGPAEPVISAPVPQLPQNGGNSSPSLAQSLAEQEQKQEKTGSQTGQKKPADESANALRAEAESLEEILRNQAHPTNLVAVRKSGTPVVATASLTAKTLFLASAHDEFEMLDFNRDWVHVRISGLSRGWIWRTSLEMPDNVPYNESAASAAPGPIAADLFHVTREETAPFPGDWAPLRGKSVKIVSVEKINDTKDAGPQLRLEFAKSVLDRDYPELAQKPQELAGIVLIFDSVDGGMIAATFQTLQQWKAGKLSDAALWRQCFFDPPETFNESGALVSH
jgi:hypothetical protein